MTKTTSPAGETRTMSATDALSVVVIPDDGERVAYPTSTPGEVMRDAFERVGITVAHTFTDHRATGRVAWRNSRSGIYLPGMTVADVLELVAKISRHEIDDDGVLHMHNDFKES